MSALLWHPAVLLALGYLAITAVFQFRPLSTRHHRLDSLGLLPRWKFFMPHADRLAVAIALRGGDDGETLGAWLPLRCYPVRTVANWLWYPEHYRSAIVWLSAQRLAMRMGRGDMGGADSSVAHRTLLRHLRRVARAERFATFQFALLTPDGEGGSATRTLFLSGLHRP